MASLDDLHAQFIKDFGKDIGGKAYAYPEEPRIPTSWFPVDLALGGGVPQGKIIEVYGKEGSGKSNMLYKIIANAQKLYPKKKHVLFNLEKTHDPKWARKLGVDTDGLYVYDPDYGEALIDMVEGLITAKDVGVIGVDSIAAIVTTRELKQSADQNDVGGGGLLASKLVRKAVAAMGRALKNGNQPTFICLNQIRSKIGGYGDPETTPGGNALKFAASMRLRLYGKDHLDAKYHDTLPVAKEINFKVVKHKVPIVAKTGDFFLVTIPHKGLPVGSCDDFKILQQYLEKYQLLVKEKDGYSIAGNKFRTLRDVRDTLNKDVKLSTEIKSAIIEVEKDAANREEGEETKFDPETGEVLEDAPVETPAPKAKKGKKDGKRVPVEEE